MKLGILFLTTALSGLSATYANAQTEPSDSVSAFTEEIIVQARKRADGETSQSVPIALTAFSAGKLEAALATNLTDVGRLTPNAALDDIGTFPGTQAFFVRGMGVSSSVPSFDPAVGLFVDGAYRAQSASGVLDVFDVEQIEILRGPQGTLFGRNVTGGAITLRTRRPTDELDVRAQVTVGRFDRVDGNVSISGPLVEDTLS
ncbi:MAG: TonB-dependent receptor plug domain-containing protein, partial [Pseudomonadota bacterium]